MKKRSIYKILLLILIVVLMVNTALIILNNSPQSEQTIVGNNTNGTVYKITAGNLDSNETAVLILGVHPREYEIHEVTNRTLANITGSDDTNNLTKKFVVYYVVTDDNITSREDTRAAGEELANMFIVPDIKNEDPFVVVDIHEIDGYYEYSNFIYSISDNNQSQGYAEEISQDIGVKNFNFTEGTSPELVTKPIANQGFNTLLFETAITNKMDEKQDIARKLIYAVDGLSP